MSSITRGEEDFKSLLRQALSQPKLSKIALSTLISNTKPPPPLFVPHLVTYSLSIIDAKHLDLCLKILKRVGDIAPESATSEKLRAYAVRLRKFPISPRHGVTAAKIASALLPYSGTSLASLELLLASIGAVERVFVPERGPQYRSKQKALTLIYSHIISSSTTHLAEHSKVLFDIANQFNKSPDDSVAAIALLSSCNSRLSDQEITHLSILICTVCLKVPQHSAHVVRVSHSTLKETSSDTVAKSCMPLIEKSLIREPQIALIAVSYLLPAFTSLDLSFSIVKSILPALVQAVKSTEVTIRSNVSPVARAVGPCLGCEDALLRIVDDLTSVLQASRYVYQRVATYDAIASLLDTAPYFTNVYNLALDSLRSWLRSKKETNEDARYSGWKTLLKAFAKMSNELGASLESSSSAQSCAAYLHNVLDGKAFESDQRVALATIVELPEPLQLLEFILTDSTRSKLTSFILSPSKNVKQDVILHAVTILCMWAGNPVRDREISSLSGKVASIIGNPTCSPVLRDPKSFQSVSDALCAVRCCVWMVNTGHERTDNALECLFRLSLDDRMEVRCMCQRAIQSIQKLATSRTSSKLFCALWKSQFTGSTGRASVARSYDFDDGMRVSERLGRTLLSAVLPNLMEDHISRIMLAANHPRLCPYPAFGYASRRSRYWSAIEQNLPLASNEYSTSEHDDWLDLCINGIFGPDGLQCSEDAAVQAALNSLAVLCDERRPYSVRVVREVEVKLHALVSQSGNLTREGFDALRTIEESDMIMESADAKVGNIRKSKIKTSFSLKQSSQEKQASSDRARAAAASASAMAEKVEKVRGLAERTKTLIHNLRGCLLAISVIAGLASSCVHNLMARFLSVVMPLVKFEMLEKPCRNALVSLSHCGSKVLSRISMDIPACLYELENGNYSKVLMTTILDHLKMMIPPPLSAEDFVLISPIIRVALLKDPNDAVNFASARKISRRRDSVGLVKTAAELLLNHCSPDAVDAAVAAAADSAGLWLVSVLEREDSAFATAADGLALLTGTALTPGTELLGQTIRGIFSGKSSVRDATLAALSRLPPLSSFNIGCPRDPALGRALWLARFDPDTANAEMADELWVNYGHPLYPQEDAPIISDLLLHDESDVRTMAAKSLAAVLVGKENESVREACLQRLFQAYDLHLPRPETEEKSVGMRRGSTSITQGKDEGYGREKLDEGWPAREGIALGFEEMALAKCLNSSDLTSLFSFLTGKSLGDQNDVVRARMATASFAVVKAAGSLSPVILLPLIEKRLSIDTSTMSRDEIVCADRTRENLVMCLGSVAGYLAPEDPRVLEITDRVLKSAIETPSEVVQNAAARCLVSLSKVAVNGEHEVEVTKTLLDKIWHKESTYGQRRGAAYALAGVSAGLGLRFVKRALLMKEINSALEEKNPWSRQGAFLLIETSALMMGRVFEPYVVNIVPFLLSSMSDPVVDVRNASWAAAQAAMSELSSQGVKLVLPSLVVGLKDRQWRTRSGSADVLGAMAFCAPRQLAQCLPQVVPKLAEALADAHPIVIQSAESAINRIAAVVRSPEVRNLSPFLLAALRDPAGKTRGAIDAMLGSEFVHVIDAASLALLIPPLHRGLRDRSSELKKRSAAIVGSMCNNVSNHADVVPYLALLLPALRVTLLDAIPDVRRTSAKALGALAISLGEKGLPDIVPWLMSALLGNVKSNDFAGDRTKGHPFSVSSSAERSGAAMGLAEVSASMSDRRLEEVLSRVLLAGQSSAEAREGGLMLIASMPRALGERFEGRIGTSLAAILQGLADDADIVREAALEAGRNLVSAYAKSSLERLLPELLNAMREKLWRIRQAATRLLGDLLLVIAGARPERPDIFGVPDSNGNDVQLDEKGSDEESKSEDGDNEVDVDSHDDNFESPEDAAAAMTVEAAMNIIEEILGVSRRNEVLAALYIARCDVSIRVRQTAMQVWKSVVSNTPRVLREIMPSVVRQIVDGLGDEDEERRGAAGKTLADLAQKLGEHVVPEILPALRTGINSKNSSERIRRGACEGLGELVFACSRQQLEMYADEFIDAVYHGLRDDLSDVRRIAAGVFSSLLKPLGATAVDAIVPRLIEIFSKEDISENDSKIALDGLTQILRACGSRLTSIVVPRLIEERPLSIAACKVLATAAKVSGSAFEPHVANLAESILDTTENLHSEINHLDEVLASLSFCGNECLKEFLSEVVLKFNEGHSDCRVAAGRVTQAFCRSVDREQILTRVGSLLDVLIRQFADTDTKAALASWEALKQLSDTVGSTEMSKHIPIIRQSLRATSSGINIQDGTSLLGLQVPKSLLPFIPAVTEGLLNGPPETKEQAALCISELVDLTSLKSLSPFVVKLTGPLIRSLSGRVPWQVKAAILKALHELIKKAPAMVRPFVPQLQGSFVKSISDTSRLVRNRACAGLIAVIPMQNRLEPLLNDLLGLALNSSSSESRSTAFRGCGQVFRLGAKLPSGLSQKYGIRASEGLWDEDEDVRKAAAKCLGCLASRCTSRDEYQIMLDIVHSKLGNEEFEMLERASILRGIGAILLAGKDLNLATYEDIKNCAEDILKASESTMTVIKCTVGATMGALILLLWSLLQREENSELLAYWRRCVLKLTEMGEDVNSDVRVAALGGLRDIVSVEEALQLCVECLISGVGSANSGVREEAEKAMSSAFLLPEGEGRINKDRLSSIKEFLSEEDGDFLERKIGKLSVVGDLSVERE